MADHEMNSPHSAVARDSVLAKHRDSVSSFSISAIFCGICLALFMFYGGDGMYHWFVVPVWLCGILIGTDAVEWCRGRLDIFDPAGILGLYGVHFFFIAPLLHVARDAWMWYIVPPPDWREWLGGMACLNLLGLILYLWAKNKWRHSRGTAAPLTKWHLHGLTFWTVLALLLVLTAAAQLYIYRSFGGIVAFIEVFKKEKETFDGLGWLFALAESFPILALMGYVLYAGRRQPKPTLLHICVVLSAFFVLKMFFGGLRGLRLNTIWGVFWAVGIVHYCWRPIPRRMIFVGLAGLVAFVYLYGFFKASGLEGVESAIQSEEDRENLAKKTGRTWDTALLGDFGRSDVQAFLLYRKLGHPRDYPLAWGRTYVASAALLIPQRLWPERPLTKVVEGSEALYGGDANEFVISRNVYGIAGEAMLNFGPLAVPLSYLLFGALIGAFQRFLTRLPSGDWRWLMVPYAVNACFMILWADSDILVWFLFAWGFLPGGLLLLSSGYLRQNSPRQKPQLLANLQIN